MDDVAPISRCAICHRSAVRFSIKKSLPKLRAAGVSVGDLRSAGFACEELRLVGVKARELQAVGASAAELKEAGYPLPVFC